LQEFSDKIAVVTGGGTGMGRELVRQLAALGCNVAMCDLSEPAMAETRELALAGSADVTVTAHRCDVSDEAAVVGFRDEVVTEHSTDHIHLLFNNAGLSGGGSFINSSREEWERCFDVCWGGVYNGTRTFLPLLIAADEAHLINTSSVNGFWASLGPQQPHTAYSTAKFAVKGFTEALITDFETNAPHVKVSLVMPGHIGTSIVENSVRYGAHDLDDEMIAMLEVASKNFRDLAPTTAADAAALILDGVRNQEWRILLGNDAHLLDEKIRSDPERAYEGSAMRDIIAQNRQ
jgi:NAD(P)-dependent dehydrogenase (short-subunit alcohol dehydrogenase family)